MNIHTSYFDIRVQGYDSYLYAFVCMIYHFISRDDSLSFILVFIAVC
jgi:hypothetical protein